MQRPPVIAVTSGEPAGIGPEICARLARHPVSARLVILGDRALLEARARQAGEAPAFADYQPDHVPADGALEVLHVPLRTASRAGRLDASNAAYVLGLLDRALNGCRQGEFSAMVTAPVHKGIINEAGIAFTGHTEYLAEKTGTARVVMMLAGAGLRVALATTHLPLKDVPGAITRPELETTLRILHADLVGKFGIARPRILVAGLNPHAGEGMDLVGPLPADTLFTRGVLAGSDAQLVMYHDQGLAVLKYAAFEDGINVTLGLPIIRTSVDHGTALDLAGTGKADPRSLFAALDLAIELAQRR